MGQRDINTDAKVLRSLHVPGEPLLIANVWDAPTASIAQSAGMRAIGTASAALAPANGYPDHGKLPPDVAFQALRRIVNAVKLPVTADLEDGYGLTARELVEGLADVGVCGINLEDTDHSTGQQIDRDRQAERIEALHSAMRELGVRIFINARIDIFFHRRPVEEGLQRAETYFKAGADCVYPIFISDLAAIRDFAALGPTNVLWRPKSTSLSDFAEAGVSRISAGPFFFQLVLQQLRKAVDAFQCMEDGILAGG